MQGETSNNPRERTERQWRVTAAFFESAIGSSAALESLLARLYRKDREALAHAHRVAALATRIGEELGMAERALDDLERAALLHDVGRLVLPDAAGIPEGVSPDRAAMERRTEQVRLASDVVKDHPFLKSAAAIVGASLECYDGSGFPNGWRGSEIPIGARVLHVADTLDALTSVCLSLACSSEVANAELVRMAGARFDPDVVAAWLRCSEEVPAALVPWWSTADRMN
jgi:response regulator RpfG family c-di-GMP phosphodiesterase